MADMSIKQGALRPYLDVQLTEGNAPYNCEPTFVKEVKLRLKLGGGPTKIVGTEFLDRLNGKIRYRWQKGDTLASGEMEAEWMVVRAGGEIESFPNEGIRTVAILPRIE